MNIQPGATLEHYRIVDKLGEGGMGVVWKAVDTTLDREVAIKVLPTDSAADADRLARFEREAKVLAKLNHPNIASIHGLHRSGDIQFLAMEMVPGDDLEQRVQAGPMSLDAALKIARQLVLALEAAHSAGVIHRDLKPANIRITPGNEVKVLDFGLAKALAPEGSKGTDPGRDPGADQDPAQSPTVTSLGTIAGLILGTAAYMAPEQARGQEVDHRADIWAFGVVVYEMLTGARLFSGKTVSDTMAAVLTHEPDWAAVPPQVRRLLRACLQREPEDRLRNIGDALLLVDDDSSVRDGSTAPSETRIGATSWLLAAAALVVGALLGVVALGYLQTNEPAPTLRFFEQPPAGGRFLGAPLPSPDGRHLAMLVQTRDVQRSIWVRSLDDNIARRIDGTENARDLRWSPDSAELLYTGDGAINRVRRDGSLHRVVTPAQLFQAVAWAPGGDVYYSTLPGGLQRVSADGGEPETLLLLEDAAFRSVEFAAPGPHLLLHQFGGSNGIYAVNTDGSDLRVVLPGADSTVRFLPPDHILYVDNRVLLAQRVDAETMTPVGEAQPVASDVDSGDFETSASGMISFVPGAAQLSRLTNFDRSGNVTGTGGAPAEYRELVLSPDGTQLLYVAADPATGNRDLWLQDLQGGAPNRFSTSPDTDHLAAFSPNGSQVVWEAHAAGDLVIMRRPTDMSTPPELLLEWNRGGGPADWSPDGTFILYTSDDGPTQNNLWAVPLDGSEPQAVINTEFHETEGRFSPDGSWLAYTSNASGREDIYIQRLDGMERVGGPQRLSSNGGVKAQWRADGKELFFLQGTTLMAVDMDLTADRPARTPRQLFDIGTRTQYHDYVVAPDGQSFMAIVEATGASANAATVVMNWRAGQ